MTPERLTQIRQSWEDGHCNCSIGVGQDLCRRCQVGELLDALAAVTAERDDYAQYGIAFGRVANESVSEHITKIKGFEEEAAQARADRLETESNGRLKTLFEKAEEARREWQRAENAEGKADRLDIRVGELEEDVRRRSTLYNELSEEKDCLEQQLAEAQSDVKHWEHSSEYAGTLLKQAEAQLTTLKDKLKEWDVVGLLNIYACSATANKLAALLATLETGSESK